MSDRRTATVLVIDPLADSYVRGLKARFPSLEVHGVTASTEASDALLAKVDVIGAKATARIFDDALLKKAGRLRWIQGFTTGTDALLRLPALRKDVLVTSMRGIHGPQMAEMAMMMMVALARDFPRFVRNQTKHVWEKHEQRQLCGKTVAILGIGVSGEALAVRAKAFGMTVIGITATPRELPGFDRMVGRDRLVEAAAEADFLCVLVPWTRENDKIVDARVLGAMKPGACLVNIARGGVCDEKALLAALQEKRIAGAALDVFAPEPLDPKHPFWDMENVIVTPHTAGDSDLYDERALEVTIANMALFLDGRPDEMVNRVEH